MDGKAKPAAVRKPHAHLAFLGLCCGAGVSTIYLSQPLLPEMGATFGAGAAAAGQIGVATQVGYALGLLSFVPMGDTLERRSLVMRMFAGTSIALLLQACAPTLSLLLLLCAVSGAFAAVTHIVLPIAPDLAEPHERGHAVGVVMTGLLMGVLLARTFSGWLADLSAYALVRMHIHMASWRLVFVVAAMVSAALVPLIGRWMPVLPPKQTMSYGAAMRSLWELWRQEPLLRESCLVGALAFGAFASFWNTLAFVMATHGEGAGVTGTFGVVGAAGTLIAAYAGRLADRRGPRYVVALGIWAMALSYLGIFAVEHLAGHTQVAPGHPHPWAFLLTLGAIVVLLDIGMQSLQLGNQTRIFALQPGARSRINTVYMTVYFVGSAIASSLSSVLWQHFGIAGVCALEMGFIGLAIWRHATGIRTQAAARVPSDEPMIHA